MHRCGCPQAHLWPRRGPDVAAALADVRLLGKVWAPPNVLPYHLRHRGIFPLYRAVGPYVAVPVVQVRRGYAGETYLRMQPTVDKPHPSGLPSDFPLETPR
jgi:hypothetical protein